MASSGQRSLSHQTSITERRTVNKSTAEELTDTTVNWIVRIPDNRTEVSKATLATHSILQATSMIHSNVWTPPDSTENTFELFFQ